MLYVDIMQYVISDVACHHATS